MSVFHGSELTPSRLFAPNSTISAVLCHVASLMAALGNAPVKRAALLFTVISLRTRTLAARFLRRWGNDSAVVVRSPWTVTVDWQPGKQHAGSQTLAAPPPHFPACWPGHNAADYGEIFFFQVVVGTYSCSPLGEQLMEPTPSISQADQLELQLASSMSFCNMALSSDAAAARTGAPRRRCGSSLPRNAAALLAFVRMLRTGSPLTGDL